MRILHTMLRVGNLERSIKFYTEVLGMKLLRTTDRPDQKYSLAFVGYDGEDRSAVLELTYNYGVDKYELGTAFGHIALEFPDVAKTCATISISNLKKPFSGPRRSSTPARFTAAPAPSSARWSSTSTGCGTWRGSWRRAG